MRTFEERMAEIQFRSEKIMQERRELRKRLLMACVPLVVCIGLCAVLYLPHSGENGGNMTALPEGMTDFGDGGMYGTLGNADIAYTELKVQERGVLSDTNATVITQTEDILAVYTLLTERYRGMEFVEDASGTSVKTESTIENKETLAPSDNYAPVTEYTLIFSTPGGAEAIYTLQGDQVTDRATGERYSLTGEQLERLCDLLGQ